MLWEPLDTVPAYKTNFRQAPLGANKQKLQKVYESLKTIYGLN